MNLTLNETRTDPLQEKPSALFPPAQQTPSRQRPHPAQRQGRRLRRLFHFVYGKQRNGKLAITGLDVAG